MTVFRKVFIYQISHKILFVSEAHVFFYWSHSCIIFVSMVLHWRGEAREGLCTSTAVTREAPLTRTLLICRYTGHSGQGETWRCILELQRHCAGPTPRGVTFMTSVNIHTHTYSFNLSSAIPTQPDWVNTPSFCSVIEGCGSEGVWCKSSAEVWKHTCLVRLTLRSGTQPETV